MLCWPVGGGGHFILSLMDDHSQRLIKTSNEYRYQGGYQCPFDQCHHSTATWSDASEFRLYLDDIYQHADALGPGHLELQGGPALGRSHTLPWLTQRIYDIHSRELIIIDVDHMSRWFVSMMKYLKHDLVMNYSKQMLWALVDATVKQRYDARLHPDQTVYRSDVIASELGAPWLAACPLMINWIQQCAMRSEPMTTGNFQSYLTERLAAEQIGHDYSDAYHSAVLHDMRTQSDQITRVTYSDIFFRTQLPQHSLIATCDSTAIRSYTAENMRLAREIVALLCQPQRDHLNAQLDRLAQLIG